MDNGNKITAETRASSEKKDELIQNPEVRLFLQDDAGHFFKERNDTYNLEAEYAKTGKNKSKFVAVGLGVCVLFVALITWFAGKYINSANSSIAVDISVFDDLNLRKLLDMVSRTEDSLRTAIADKAKLERNWTAEKHSAEMKRDADIHSLDLMPRISRSEKEKIRQRIDETYSSTVLSLAAKYEPEIREKDTIIEELRAQLAELNDNDTQRAQEQKAAVDSQRQVFEMEKKQLVDEYEKTIAVLQAQLETQRTESFEEQKRALNEISSKYEAVVDSLDPLIEDSAAAGIVKKYKESQAAKAAAENTSAPENGTPENSMPNTPENPQTAERPLDSADSAVLFSAKQKTALFPEKPLPESAAARIVPQNAAQSASSENAAQNAQEDLPAVSGNFGSPEAAAETAQSAAAETASAVQINTAEADISALPTETEHTAPHAESASKTADFVWRGESDRQADPIKMFDDYAYLSKQVQSVPQTNTIPEYVKTMHIITENLSAETAALREDAENLEAMLAKTKKERDGFAGRADAAQTENSELSAVLEALAEQNGHAGYVLSDSDLTLVRVFIAEKYRSSAAGSKASVYAYPREKLGTVTIAENSGIFFALPENPETAAKIHANCYLKLLD
ncbi:MAG: hypothetical protein NC041_09790 [Bacteroides sp.]|nr:hypothetical protein [Prevotella sp.]MCM1408543.1 hypothetical protein [Treponema brennaborense]MCM1470743.1 hypothetical protein [Bacteroides sp.]